MNENLKKFVEALRSGKYKQDYKNLRTGDCYCAMGVACDLCDPGAWKSDNYGNFSFQGFGKIPPQRVGNFIGLTFEDCEAIMYWNDKEKLTFPQIADRIEEMFK